MNESVKELLSLAEGDAKWFDDDTARNFERFAEKLKQEEKAELDLLATVYRERAEAVQRIVEKVRENFATDGPSDLPLENT
jgi:hypothetical protein